MCKVCVCVLCVCVVWDLCVLSHPAVAVAAIYGPPPSDTTICYAILMLLPLIQNVRQIPAI